MLPSDALSASLTSCEEARSWGLRYGAALRPPDMRSVALASQQSSARPSGHVAADEGQLHPQMVAINPSGAELPPNSHLFSQPNTSSTRLPVALTRQHCLGIGRGRVGHIRPPFAPEVLPCVVPPSSSRGRTLLRDANTSSSAPPTLQCPSAMRFWRRASLTTA